MGLLLLIYLLTVSPITSISTPSPSWSRTIRLANARWMRAARDENASAAVEAHNLFFQAWTDSNQTATSAYWESVRIATIGCMHELLPSPLNISRVLQAELTNGVPAHSEISQVVAMTALNPTDFLALARAWAFAFDLSLTSPLILKRIANVYAARPNAIPMTETDVVAAKEIIVFFSGHFGDHPVGHHITYLLQQLSMIFTIICVSTREDDHSNFYTENKAACGSGKTGSWIVTNAAMSAENVATILALTHADLIISLDGYDTTHRSDALSLRPAPRIASWFGFLATTGSQWCDYIIADVVSIPLTPQHSIFFSERVLYTRRTFFTTNFQQIHPEVIGKPTYSYNSSGSSFSFCSFSQLFKMSREIANAWADLLTISLPFATLELWNHPPIAAAGLLRAHPRLASLATSGRLIFTATAPRNEHLIHKRLRCGLGLDTNHYNGHVSVADLLWAGVPVLTIAEKEGVGFAGRAASSLILAAGAPSLFVAETFNEYIATATAVARAYEKRETKTLYSNGEIQSNSDENELLWRPTFDSPLFDRDAFAQDFAHLIHSIIV